MDSIQYKKFLEVVTAMEENEEDLTDFESDFLSSMQDKIENDGQDLTLTSKQSEVLIKIAQKLEIDADILS